MLKLCDWKWEKYRFRFSSGRDWSILGWRTQRYKESSRKVGLYLQGRKQFFKERFQSSYLYFIIPIEKSQFTPSKARKPFFHVLRNTRHCEYQWCVKSCPMFGLSRVLIFYISECFCKVHLLYRQHCVANQPFSKFSQVCSEHAIEILPEWKVLKKKTKPKCCICKAFCSSVGSVKTYSK